MALVCTNFAEYTRRLTKCLTGEFSGFVVLNTIYNWEYRREGVMSNLLYKHILHLWGHYNIMYLGPVLL